MISRIYFAFVVFFLLTGAVRAEQALDIRLGSNSARFMYASEVLGGSFGAASMEFGVFFNEYNDSLLHAGLFIASESLENPITISLGLRGYYADAGNNPGQTQADAGALAIGGELVLVPKNFGGLGFAAGYYVAPSVLSFMDAERLVEYGVRMEFSVTEQTKLILGYQNIEVELESGAKLDIDSGFIAGIGLRF